MSTMVITRSQLDRRLLELVGMTLFFLYIYAPSFKFFPVNTSYVVILVAMGYACLGNNLSKFADFLQYKTISVFLFLYTFCILYIGLVPLFSDEEFDKVFLITYVRLLFDFLLVIPFFIFLFAQELNYTFKDFLGVLVKIGVIQGIIATLMFVVPGMRDFVFSYIMEPPSEKLARELYRGYGLANDFYFAVPLFQGLVFVVNSILYILTNEKKYLFYYPFILLSMVMNARVTLVIIPIFFLVIFVLSFYYDDLKWIRRMSAIFFILSLIALAAVIYFLLNPDKAQSIMWIIEGVLGGLGALGGDISQSKTITTIAQEHFHFPHLTSELWFGKGLVVFENPQSPVRSDLGYIRYIYYGGILLSLVFYYAILRFSITRVITIPDVLIKVLLITLLLSLFTVHLKGDIFNSSAYLKGYFLIFMYTIYEGTRRLATK